MSHKYYLTMTTEDEIVKPGYHELSQGRTETN